MTITLAVIYYLQSSGSYAQWPSIATSPCEKVFGASWSTDTLCDTTGGRSSSSNCRRPPPQCTTTNPYSPQQPSSTASATDEDPAQRKQRNPAKIPGSESGAAKTVDLCDITSLNLHSSNNELSTILFQPIQPGPLIIEIESQHCSWYQWLKR